MRNQRILAGVTTLALVAAGAMTAFAPPVTAGPAGEALTSPAGGELVRSSDGSVHALIPAQPLARPAGLARNASPAAVAKAFLSQKAKAFGASAADLRPSSTVGFGSKGSTVRFVQTLGGLPVLGGELVVSLDAGGALQSITGETAKGSALADGRIRVSAATQASRARAFVAKRTGADHLRAQRVNTVVFNPQLLGLPGGADVNLRADRFLVTARDVSYFVFVHKRLGVLGGFSNAEDANNRLVCAANNKVFPFPEDAYCEGGNTNIQVTRAEGQAASFDKDTNNVYNNLGYTQRAFTDFTGFDLAPNIGITGREAGGRYGTVKRLRATVHFCQDFVDCPMENAFWWDTFHPTTGNLVGGQMFYGLGLTQDDITGHEVAHGVTSATSNLLYWFQSGAINESMSDVFGELVDLVDVNYGSPSESASNAWKIGEGSPVGVLRSMSNPPSVIQGPDPRTGNLKGQPDKMTSTNWWDVYDYEDSGGVHLNSGVGNKAAYLIAAGATFNGQTVRGLGYAKTFSIYWAAQNLLTSGASYRDLYTVLPAACTKLIGERAITADDCAQVKKAVHATEMNKSPRATENLPVSTTQCPTGKTVRTTMSQGFDKTPAGWGGALLAKRDVGFDYVRSGADSAFVSRGPVHSLRHTAGVTVPAGGKLRINYAMFAGFEQHGSVKYRTTPTGTLRNLPTAGAVNRGPWQTSPGWSSARWDLSSLAGKKIYLRFATNDNSGESMLLLDNVTVYRCV